MQIIAKLAWNTTLMLQRLILQEKPIILKSNRFWLTPPKFDHSKPSIGKTILVDKIEKTLDYTFQIQSL
jgi:hypothetical protein